MRDPQSPVLTRREDYRVPEFLIDSVDLYFDIHADVTRVTADLSVRRNPRSDAATTPLKLDGEGILLRGVFIDGIALSPDEYVLSEKHLEVTSVPDAFRLRTIGEIDPRTNTALEGLYVSHGMYCTQCEAEGFRRITWFADRPDVMSRFRTTVEADVELFPLLLSNGNRVAHEVLLSGRHRATWEDPFPKPCYLFALVAGDLACREDIFLTRSGRKVTLQIFVEPHDLDKTEHGMESLKRAMRWDEEVFGCEYDLDIYMIVAVSHFNMGAMENKGLNVFNTSCVLANSRTQTDKAFQRVEAVIAHEYFHNWSGNRVTCRDWFQLSLKEGFTVFRDSEFSKDMHSRAVKRIEEVNFLRTVQFPEDAGPLAHPVRPESYVEINNFYTVTIYEKGAEVVRMLQTLLGEELFLRACRLYFDRHDGEAATCEDFVRAMEDASGQSLTQFRHWYTQAGTPEVKVVAEHDAANSEYVLKFSQSCQPSAGQADKQPFVIPVRFGLLDAVTGAALPILCHDARMVVRGDEALFVFDAPEAVIRLSGLPSQPLPSLLRGFSAPVKWQFDYRDEELVFLARHDSDAFNRWNSGQALALRCLLRMVGDVQAGRSIELPELLQQYVAAVLGDVSADHALMAEMLTLPAESYIADQMRVADPGAIHTSRQEIRRALAFVLKTELLDLYERLTVDRPWSAEPGDIASRALRSSLLDLLSELPDADIEVLIHQQYDHADNMTDQFSALRAAVHGGFACADDLLARFAAQWKNEALVMDQWFSVQVTSPALDGLQRAKVLMSHPQFDLINPNRVRALIGAFAGSNPAQFHREDGEGYRFVAEQLIALDLVNPQIAARIGGQFSRWRRCDAVRQQHAAVALDTILAQEGLSPNLYEVIQKTRHDGM